jgi:hypothetical protein
MYLVSLLSLAYKSGQRFFAGTRVFVAVCADHNVREYSKISTKYFVHTVELTSSKVSIRNTRLMSGYDDQEPCFFETFELDFGFSDEFEVFKRPWRTFARLC